MCYFNRLSLHVIVKWFSDRVHNILQQLFQELWPDGQKKKDRRFERIRKVELCELYLGVMEGKSCRVLCIQPTSLWVWFVETGSYPARTMVTSLANITFNQIRSDKKPSDWIFSTFSAIEERRSLSGSSENSSNVSLGPRQYGASWNIHVTTEFPPKHTVFNSIAPEWTTAVPIWQQ